MNKKKYKKNNKNLTKITETWTKIKMYYHILY